MTCVSHLLNREELDDGSAWQKIMEQFKGPMIPLGARVTFKPSDARERQTKIPSLTPKVGYVIEAGDKLSRKMLAWNLHDFAKVNYAFKCENVPMSLQRPHVTDRVEMDNPLVFHCKQRMKD